MAVQDSTFKTVHVEDNEIIKANDFEFAFEQLVENVSKATQMFLESTQDFVINGKVIPNTGMNVAVSPIYGVCKSTGQPFGRTETTDETIGFEGSSSGRIDIIQVRGEWETYDNQQRAFNDPDTDTQTYQYVDTKKLMRPVYQVKKGIEGAGVAPDKDSGWVKLAEVSIRAGATSILATDIYNITADVAGLNNDDWTNEQDVTYNIGYISDVNARFRVQHNEDGTHAENSIDAVSLDIGTGVNQINGNILPVGASVSIPNETISAADSILSVFTKAASLLTTLYNAYLQYGTYGFYGELSISSLLDANNDLEKPISISAAGDGTAVIKVAGNAVLSIDANGKLSTNGYTASSNNHLVTKAVTDGLATLISNLDTRVSNIETSLDYTEYSNGVISSGTTGRFNPDSTSIYAATTTNITLSGTQTIDGQTLTNGATILVKDQTDPTENGLYQYATNSAWSRLTAFSSPTSLKGKIFTVSNGTVNAKKMFYMPRVNFSDSESFGTDDINILEYFGSVSGLANKVIMRDANGRAQVAAPSAESDIARKAEITALYGNVVGQALGTAAVGTCTTFARSDHVHPLPTKFGTVCSETNSFGTQLIASRSGSANMASVKFQNCLGTLGYLAQGAVDARFVRYNAAANTCYTILDTSAAVTIAQGGTGATTAANARTNLGLGSAATKGVFTRSAVGDIGWGTEANRTKVVDVSAMAYWNGAYQDTSSNLRYYCGGAFGTAATCAATAFRSGTWWPDSLSCGCVCLASCATNATCAFCADGPVHQYTWNGRSSCNTSYFCVYYDGNNGGQLCCWCNKMGDRMLIVAVRNGCDWYMSFNLPPGGKSSCSIQCMTCGTSCVRVILF